MAERQVSVTGSQQKKVRLPQEEPQELCFRKLLRPSKAMQTYFLRAADLLPLFQGRRE